MKRLLDTNNITVYLWPGQYHWHLSSHEIAIGPVQIFLRFWFIKRLVWRLITRLLWLLSARLRDEYKAYQNDAWGRDCACVDFSEWISWRLFPEKVAAYGASK